MSEKTWQEKFSEALEASVDLSQAMHTTMGFVSVCWDPKPKGVFESTMAHEATEMLERWVTNRYSENKDTNVMAVRSEESIKMEQEYNRKQALDLAIQLETSSPGAPDTRLKRITDCANAFVEYIKS